MSSDSDIVPATTNSYTPSTDTVENNASHVESTETKPNPTMLLLLKLHKHPPKAA